MQCDVYYKINKFQKEVSWEIKVDKNTVRGQGYCFRRLYVPLRLIKQGLVFRLTCVSQYMVIVRPTDKDFRNSTKKKKKHNR